MKARKLKAILNNTEYHIHETSTKINVGSSLCSDLINLDKETKKIRYALDTFNKGRESLKYKDELLFIWDKLHVLVESGEIDEIITGADTLENPIPVYVEEGGEIITRYRYWSCRGRIDCLGINSKQM